MVYLAEVRTEPLNFEWLTNGADRVYILEGYFIKRRTSTEDKIFELDYRYLADGIYEFTDTKVTRIFDEDTPVPYLVVNPTLTKDNYCYIDVIKKGQYDELYYWSEGYDYDILPEELGFMRMTKQGFMLKVGCFWVEQVEQCIKVLCDKGYKVIG